MQDPLYNWMTQMNLIDIYPIFQRNGISYDQVRSLSTDTLNEMGVNVGQRKRFFAATGKDRSSSPQALPSYGQVSPLPGPPMMPHAISPPMMAPMITPVMQQPVQAVAPQPIIINNNNNNNNNNNDGDDTVLCFICNGTRKQRVLWFVRTIIYIDGEKTRDHVEELKHPFWLNEQDGCRACQKTGRLPKKSMQCPDCNGQGVVLLTIHKVTKNPCCGPKEVVLSDRNVKNCPNCLGDGIL